MARNELAVPTIFPTSQVPPDLQSELEQTGSLECISGGAALLDPKHGARGSNTAKMDDDPTEEKLVEMFRIGSDETVLSGAPLGALASR